MKCPRCNSEIHLELEEIDSNCPHCAFYAYLNHSLRIACSASIKVDLGEDFYFKNVHQRIYNPFTFQNEGELEPIEGAKIICEHLIEQFRVLINEYPKEDLLFMMVALRELATWKILLEPDDVWASTQVRNVVHVFTNLVSSFENDLFGYKAIFEDTDFISLFVITEKLIKS